MLEKINWEQVAEWVTKYSIKVALFLVGIFITYLVARWASGAAKSGIKRSKLDPSLGQFLSQLVFWAVVVFGVIFCLDIFGVETASFAALLAGAGLAVGMALQGTLGNFAAGVMLLVFRPFKTGDIVTLAGESGKIASVDIFNTLIDTFDNRRIAIPNNSVFGSKIENVNFHPTRRVDVNVGTDYDADLDKTREVLKAAVEEVQGILKEPEPAIVLNELGSSSINWTVRVWVNTEDYWAIKDALTREVKYKLDASQIGIPFPQMDLHIPRGLPSNSKPI